MAAKFWDAVGSKLADRWLTVAGPALLFWAGGMLAWALSAKDLVTLLARIEDLTAASLGTQLVVLTAGLIVVTASVLFVDRLTLPATRLLEGYWPPGLRPLRRALVKRRSRAIERKEGEWQALAAKIGERTATLDERIRYADLEVQLHRVPAAERRMPTRLGDVLRAAETLPIDKYGLDAVKCWPRFWLVLPETTRKELTAARDAMDAAVRACIWGTLAVGFAIWSPWALVLGPLIARLAYVSWACPRAEVFADLVESSFDVHRAALYAALRWPLPGDPASERAAGELLTDYLWRGSEGATPAFTQPKT
jgi:hypothetical protein